MFAAILVLLSTGPMATGSSPVDSFLEACHGVGSEGEGNREASRAWSEFVAKASESDLAPLLLGLDDATAVQANWIRSAIDAVAHKALSRGKQLPVNELEDLLTDRRHDPRARRLAFELIVKSQPAARDRIVPTLLDDPSPELRREAVSRVIEEAQAVEQSTGKTASLALYKKALGAARDIDQIRSMAEKLKKLGQPVDLPRHFGFLMDWHVVGPFDNSGRKGFDTAYEPERKVALQAELEGKGGPVRWKELSTRDDFGMIDLNGALGQAKEVLGYGHTVFMSTRGGEVEFRLASVNAFKIWLNGKLLFERNEYHHGTELDHYRVTGELRSGRNDILLKVCQNEQTQDYADKWRFQIRVCDSTGTAILSRDRPD